SRRCDHADDPRVESLRRRAARPAGPEDPGPRDGAPARELRFVEQPRRPARWRVASLLRHLVGGIADLFLRLADAFSDLTLRLLPGAFAFHFGIVRDLAELLLRGALGLVELALDLVLVHVCPPEPASSSACIRNAGQLGGRRNDQAVNASR